MSTTTEQALHMYEIDEAGCVTHWASAASEEEAIRLVLETAEVEEPDELEATEVPDDRPYPVTFVDGFDHPDRWTEEVPPGATIEYIRDDIPKVTATAGEWARFTGAAYTGCSEW